MEVQHLFSVMKRRRGIYLAEWSESEWGTSDHDAFPTEAEAKRWCAAKIERKRLPWREDNPGILWFAEVIIVETDPESDY